MGVIRREIGDVVDKVDLLSIPYLPIAMKLDFNRLDQSGTL
jgi:hypothetical protein